MIIAATGWWRSALMGVAGALLLGLGTAQAAPREPTASVASLEQRADRELAARPGKAVLDYERARLLAPRAPRVNEGLAKARVAADLPPEMPNLLARALRWLSPDEWSRLALGALALAAVAGTAAAWRVRRRWTGPAFAAGLALSLAAGAVAWRTAPRRNDAVVVAPNAVARIAPFAGAEPAFTAQEGSHAVIEATHEGYTRIRGGGGTGWVESSAVEPILAHS